MIMKKLLLSLCAVIALSFTANAKSITDNSMADYSAKPEAERLMTVNLIMDNVLRQNGITDANVISNATANMKVCLDEANADGGYNNTKLVDMMGLCMAMMNAQQ